MRPQRTSAALLCLGAMSANSFTWPMGPSSPPTTLITREEDVPGVVNKDTWDSSKLSVILDNYGKLESYEHKPDCFRRAASSIRVQCSELDMHEEQRVQAAITMTICELATAKHTPPLECTPIISAEGIFVSSSSMRIDTCVEALSRSAQYWSSYSGYLREIPQLCHAFRRGNDIDLARDVYRNATLQAISTLHALNESEHRRRSFFAEVNAVTTNLAQILHDMNQVNHELDRSSKDIWSELRDIKEQALDMMQNKLHLTLSDHSDAYDSMVAEVSRDIRAAIGNHATSLDLLLPPFQAALETHLASVFSEVRSQHQDMNEIALTAQANWHTVTNEIGHMQQAISALITSASQSALALDAHVDQAVLARRVQAETTDAVSRLNTVLTDLVATTQEEMEKINNTAISLQNKWASFDETPFMFFDWRYWPKWSQHGLQWLVYVLFRVDSGVLERVLSSHLFGTAGVVCLPFLLY
ncbi:hypothetical protein BDW22DRAFT_1357628 [Trametopsis cervina]|nr:hypothetical protein BDW22DRAFT_1357628 [Trametopsis cervina]